MKFTNKQKENISKTFLTLTHITFAGLIVTQITMREKFDIIVFIIGTTMSIVLFILGIITDKGGEK